MPATPDANCLAKDTGTVGGGDAAWQYSFSFSECNMAPASGPSAADENGITWYTYSVYLNYDNDISSMTGITGTGNLQQLDQAGL